MILACLKVLVCLLERLPRLLHPDRENLDLRETYSAVPRLLPQRPVYLLGLHPPLVRASLDLRGIQWARMETLGKVLAI
jgi:hypothetical protein